MHRRTPAQVREGRVRAIINPIAYRHALEEEIRYYWRKMQSSRTELRMAIASQLSTKYETIGYARESADRSKFYLLALLRVRKLAQGRERQFVATKILEDGTTLFGYISF